MNINDIKWLRRQSDATILSLLEQHRTANETLAARVEQLREANKMLDDALKESHPNGSFGKVFALWNKAREALYTTDDTASILAERDARIREEMLDMFRAKHRDYSNEIERDMADELGKGSLC